MHNRFEKKSGAILESPGENWLKSRSKLISHTGGVMRIILIRRWSMQRRQYQNWQTAAICFVWVWHEKMERTGKIRVRGDFMVALKVVYINRSGNDYLDEKGKDRMNITRAEATESLQQSSTSLELSLKLVWAAAGDSCDVRAFTERNNGSSSDYTEKRLSLKPHVISLRGKNSQAPWFSSLLSSRAT